MVFKWNGDNDSSTNQCQRTIRERSKLQEDNHTVRMPPALVLRFDYLAEFVTQWCAPDAAIQKGLAELLAVFGRGSEILQSFK